VGLSVRVAEGDADLERALALTNAVFPQRAVSIEDVRSYLASVREHEDVLAWEDGRLVGTGSIATESEYPQPWANVVVPPPERRRGVGTALFAAVSAWARERGHSEVRGSVEESDPDGLAWATRRGFREIAREIRVTLELRDVEPPPVEPPAGIEIVTWAERPELGPGIYDVYCEAHPDVPGEEETEVSPYEDWLVHHMQGAGDKPEATFVALAGDEAVGYAKFFLTEAQPTTAFHDMTGVKRAWRGRGIAGALKRAQVAWAIDRGYTRLVTGNEERNEPIRRLNERLGYGPEPGVRILLGPIASRTASVRRPSK
jgi:GNAT superfamily N-acetyltransferase